MSLLRVCVTGAGAAGLCAARYLTRDPDVIFNTTVFEQTSSIGGTWVYNEKTRTDEHGLPIHSSMYSNLRTNLPKQLMAFPDFPFPSEWNSFMSQPQVLQYLHSYAKHFNLHKYIHFKSLVKNVRPLKRSDGDKVAWEVEVEHVETKESQVHMFDAVIVSNGHFSRPIVPNIPGLQSFTGLVMHSHDYRDTRPFHGKDVVVLGSGNSGIDITLLLAEKTHKVYFSHRKVPFAGKLPANVEEHTPISTVSADGMVNFEDGQQRKVDAIIFCTGYQYSFPFLSDDCKIQVEDNRVTHLYKHIFNIKYPSMSFIGLCSLDCPFPFFSIHARCIISVLKGKSRLPSEEEMRADEARDFKAKISAGFSQRHAHYLEGTAWDYCRDITRLAGCDKLSGAYETLHEYVLARRKYFPMEFKNDEFQLSSDEKWAKIN